MEIALHGIFLIVLIVCTCPTAWGIGNLHQTAAVEEEPCPSAVGSMSPGAVDLVEEEAFDRFRRLISVEAAVFDSLPVNNDRLLAAVLAGTRLCRRHEAPFHNLSTTCPDGVRTGRRNRLEYWFV